jgi:hypothetical protein
MSPRRYIFLLLAPGPVIGLWMLRPCSPISHYAVINKFSLEAVACGIFARENNTAGIQGPQRDHQDSDIKAGIARCA